MIDDGRFPVSFGTKSTILAEEWEKTSTIFASCWVKQKPVLETELEKLFSANFGFVFEGKAKRFGL